MFTFLSSYLFLKKKKTKNIFKKFFLFVLRYLLIFVNQLFYFLLVYICRLMYFLMYFLTYLFIHVLIKIADKYKKRGFLFYLDDPLRLNLWLVIELTWWCTDGGCYMHRKCSAIWIWDKWRISEKLKLKLWLFLERRDVRSAFCLGITIPDLCIVI